MKHQYNLVAEDDEKILQHWENLTTMKKKVKLVTFLCRTEKVGDRESYYR